MAIIGFAMQFLGYWTALLLIVQISCQLRRIHNEEVVLTESFHEYAGYRQLSVSEMVESLLAMWAAGGERAEDLDQFRPVALFARVASAGRAARNKTDRRAAPTHAGNTEPETAA